MSVNNFISARKSGSSPDKSFFDKSLSIIGEKAFEKLIYIYIYHEVQKEKELRCQINKFICV